MQSVKYDLAIIGASAAGFAAAGVAAQHGARVVIIKTAAEPLEGAVAPTVPNFIWRMLDLHQCGLKQSAAPAQTLLAVKADDDIHCFVDQAQTARVFATREAQAGAVSSEFFSAVERFQSANATTNDDRRPMLDFPVYATANEILDDYFHDERIKTLLSAATLLRFGIAGDEAGSAAALRALCKEAWPSRTAQGPKLRDALKAAAMARQVVCTETSLVSVMRSGKSFILTTTEDISYQSRRVMAVTADIARSAGLTPVSSDGALQNSSGAVATIRILLEEAPALDGDKDQAIFLAVDDREHLLRARDAMMEGRRADPPPFSFSLEGAAIIARAPYCPSALLEDGEVREWTGQDKQALGRQIFDIAKARLKQKIVARTIDVRIDQRPAAAFGIEVPVPPTGCNEISAAAELALELMRDA